MPRGFWVRTDEGRRIRFERIVILPILTVGCDLPRDVDGTHSVVTQGNIRVGISARKPLAVASEGSYSGLEVELVEKFAKQLHAEPQWRLASETELFEQLHHGELDVVIGGITDDTPWSDYVGLTQSYAESIDQITGDSKKHVWAVRAGENRWLLELGRFLQTNRNKVASRVLEAGQ